MDGNIASGGVIYRMSCALCGGTVGSCGCSNGAARPYLSWAATLLLWILALALLLGGLFTLFLSLEAGPVLLAIAAWELSAAVSCFVTVQQRGRINRAQRQILLTFVAAAIVLAMATFAVGPDATATVHYQNATLYRTLVGVGLRQAGVAGHLPPNHAIFTLYLLCGAALAAALTTRAGRS